MAKAIRVLNRAPLTGTLYYFHGSAARSAWAMSLLIGLCVYATCARASSSNWPGWRGDDTGSSTAAAPMHWDAQNGVAWKRRLPGEGTSSPIIWQDRIFLTASAEAGAALIEGARDRDRQVRIGSIKPLGETAAAHAGEGAKVAEVLVSLMDDKDGLIRHAAIQSLSTFPKNVGPNRQAVIDRLKPLREDPNSLVAKAARTALRRGLRVR